MKQAAFKSKLDSAIDAKLFDILARKPDNQQFLTFMDAITLTTAVKNIFKSKLQICPEQVKVACTLSEATLAPTLATRIKLIKAVVGFGGGLTGLVMIITGIGMALGWGTGVISTVIAFFVGTPLTGPIGLIVGGVGIAGVAGYFAVTGNPQKNTERFRKALKGGLDQAIDAIWEEYGDRLSDT